MSLPFGIHPRRFLRWSALAAIVTNVIIVFTGGVVRVSGSGLGCPDWPTCEGTAVAPTAGGDHAGWQAAVEFGNRLLTFPVLLSVVAVFIAVRMTRPHARSVEWLAIALPLGVLGQALLGGVTVLTGLSPSTVAAHFLLSMALIAFAVILHERVRHRTVADESSPEAATLAADAAQTAPRGVQHATTAILAVAAVVLVLGTLVTGAGPHGGDPGAARFAIDIRFAAIAHADAVWLLVGVTAATMVVTWRTGPPRFRRAIRLLLVVQLAQGGIGYAQYALGVPPTLVSLHIVGAAVMWGVACAAWARARPAPAPSSETTTSTTEDELATR